jgi:hypothetical protein
MMQGLVLYRFAPELWFDATGPYPTYVLDVGGLLVFTNEPEFRTHLQEHGVLIPLERLPIYATYTVSKLLQSNGPVRYLVTCSDNSHTASVTTNSKASVCLNVINDVHKADTLIEWKGVRLVNVVFEMKSAVAGINGRKKGPAAITGISAARRNRGTRTPAAS